MMLTGLRRQGSIACDSRLILAMLLVVLGLCSITGCETAPPPPRPVEREPAPPRVEDRLPATPPRRLLAWPMRNDAGADLLAPSDLALLRFHRGERDQIAARLGGMRMIALDESLRTPLAAAGIELVSRDREADLDLAAALAAVEAEALLTARVFLWQREPEGRTGAPIRVGVEVTLLAPGDPRPLWTWRVDRRPLGVKGARQVDMDARALLSGAGRRLAAALAQPAGER